MTATRRGAALLAALAALAALAVLSGCAGPAPVAEEQLLLITPSPAPTAEPDPIEQFAQQRLASMSLEQKVRSMVMVHLGGLDAAGIHATIAAEGLAGALLMGSNVPDPPSGLAELTALLHADAELPALLAIDQEGGIVRRIRSDDGPPPWELREQPAEASREAFLARSALLHGLGVDVNFGIVADVVSDPGSFLFDRSYGSTAQAVAERVAAAVIGEHGTVLSTLKHFPGHGAAAGDSHYGIPATSMSLQQWRTEHAPPFAAGIEAGAELVMLGHLRFTDVDPAPASLSARWVSLLREEFGFDGVIVTDDLSMLEHSEDPEFADQAATAVRAVAAGVTLLLYVGPVDLPALVAAVTAAVESGTIDDATIDDAVLRLLRLRRGLSADAG